MTKQINFRLLYKVLLSLVLTIGVLMVRITLGQANHVHYLDTLKRELTRPWPDNRTINLVFHGHSVPSGYFKTPRVNTLEAYPYVLLGLLKDRYPNAVINSIVTAIGGENSAQGVLRMDSEVLPHRPDVLFIDYGLNDRRIPLDKAEASLRNMIESARIRGIRVILLTPSPDISVDWTAASGDLSKQRQLISALAQDYQVGLVDVYGMFLKLIKHGDDLSGYMAQSNHPNALGHRVIAEGIWPFFVDDTTGGW